MRIKLGKSWQTKLAYLPEQGMGSQHVDILLKSGQIIESVPVFNGEDCEVKNPIAPEEILDIRLHQK